MATLCDVPAEILTQLVSLPTRRKRVVGGTFPNPSTGHPRKSDPHDHRLPSEARISPCLSPKLNAGVPLPTGNFTRPRPNEPAGNVATINATTATSKTAAPPTAAVFSLVQLILCRVARLPLHVEVPPPIPKPATLTSNQTQQPESPANERGLAMKIRIYRYS
jgi:hypothetical protein